MLIRLARLLEEELRSSDLVARYGGEEFAIILVETTPEQGRDVADKVRVAIGEHPFELPNSELPPIRVTASVGLAGYPRDAREASAMISMADQALYLAKEAGRNLVVSCSKEDQS